MGKDEYDGTSEGGKLMLKILFVGVLFALFGGVMFIGGTKFSCTSGFSQGLKCVEPKEIAVCNFDGNKLIIPADVPIEIRQLVSGQIIDSVVPYINISENVTD